MDVSDCDASNFEVGDLFHTYDELEKKLDKYKKTHYVEFWKRDARTIAVARRRMPDKHMNADLKYYEIKLCCIHGGRPFKQKGSGIRNTSTFKQDCPAHITLRINSTGNALEVKSISTEHNHERSEVLFKHLPHQRTLTPEIHSKAVEFLSMNPNKKLLQQKLATEANKVVLLKDITNISSSMKTSQTKNNLDVVVERLIGTYGASVEVYKTEKSDFLGLFFQDQQMMDAFRSYPEYIAVDATYKLLKLGFPLYIIICEDSNGMTEIVACCILVTEDAKSVRWMFEVFKKLNSKWDKVQVVMADKDMKERAIVKECIPQCSLLICLFHVMRTFKREITCDKMGISSGQRILCLELLQKLAYASSEQQYPVKLLILLIQTHHHQVQRVALSMLNTLPHLHLQNQRFAYLHSLLN